MSKEREQKEREEFNEGCRLLSDSEASELSDVGNGAIVDLTGTKYLYRDETWLQYPKFTTFHSPRKEFRGSSRPRILYRRMQSLTFFGMF